MLDGVTQLIMMKSDVLDTLETVKACVAYEINGKQTKDFPFDIENNVKPVYKQLKGWNTDMTKMSVEGQFPTEFMAYVSFLEQELGVPISIISLGPDRKQTIIRK